MIKKASQGFTVIESLVAISVLVMVVIGATSAVQTGLSSYILTKEQVIAFYLAQEGFEQIKNMRDENNLTDRNWLWGISENSDDPCYFGFACTVSPVETNLATRCPGVGSCPVLRQDSTSGFYGYNLAWTPTIFRREIILSSVNSEEISVTVTVNWSKGLINRQFKLKENIFDWQ